MATITIPQLNTVTVPTGNDLIEVVQPDSGSASGYATGKESLSQVANLIANGTQYSGLTTDDQTIVGAINEVKNASGMKGLDTTLTNPVYEAYTVNGSDTLEYTATEDCLVSLTCQGSSDDSMTMQIDNTIVLISHYQSPIAVSGTFPLKTGQTVSKRITTSQCYASITVHRLE